MSKEQKKICFIVTNFISERVGGVEIQTFLIGKYLAQKKWNVSFIAETSDPSKVNTASNYENIEIHWIQRKSLFSFFRKDLMNTLKKIKPDCIYQRGRSRFTSSPIPYWFAEQNQCKILYHCAEDNDLVKEFNTTEFKKNKLNPFKIVPLYIHAKLSDYFFQQTVIKSNTIIAQNTYQLAGFESLYNKQATIVNSSQEVPGPPFQKNERFYILWVANTGRRKQLELFVDLARQLQITRAEFIIAGTMPHKNYWQEIQNRMNGLNNIRYIGPLSWDESNMWFSKASIFVNTTLPGREGFPNTYIQAWMRETPVVTLHCDPDGVIEKNQMGFHSKSFERMTADVNLLIENEELRKTMGRNARNYALKNHDIRMTVERLDKIFSAIV
ncbi:glycosyltransferase family 4 protein [bacterium]|nr:glycosyltransferase family 4 protein [bacterium]